MKKSLFLALLLAMFMVSCQEDVMTDLEDFTPRISRCADNNDSLTESVIESTTDTTKSRYTVRIKNSYYHPQLMWVAVRWEVFNTDYSKADVQIVSDNGLAYYNHYFEGYFDAKPGEYIVTASTESIGQYDVDFEIKAQNGGEINFELINGVGEPAWAEPTFFSR